jgi:hypothetical protein
MTVRKQTLEEWFTQHQLATLSREHFYIPCDLEIDVTEVVRLYEVQGQRAPITAIVVKAAGLLAMARPCVNRVVLKTALGTRVVQFEQAHVNMPVRMDHAGESFLSATVIKHADRLSVAEIVAKIREAQQRNVHELPIGKLFVKNENTLLNRVQLRARHALAYGVPSLFEKHAGGISVSSLLRREKPGVLVRMPSYGPTALSLCPGTLRSTSDGRSMLFLGVGYDHFALPGRELVEALDHLGSLLAEGDPAHFGPAATEVPATSSTPPTRHEALRETQTL